MKTLSPQQALVRLGILLLISQCVMLLLIFFLFGENSSVAIILQPLLIAFGGTPFIFKWVVKPFIMESERLTDKISHLAHHDPVTRLPNRKMLVESLMRLGSSMIRHHYYGAVLYIDIKGFKHINSQYGHDDADKILIEIARRLNACFRLEDFITRAREDEFAIILNHLGNDTAEATSKAQIALTRLMEELKKPFNIGTYTLNIEFYSAFLVLEPERVDPELVIGKVQDLLNK